MMEITQHTSCMMCFKDLEFGDIFKVKSSLYIKIDTVNMLGNAYNSVILDTGRLVPHNGSAEVLKAKRMKASVFF